MAKAKSEKEEVVYTKSTAQLDAEARKDLKAEDLHTFRPETVNPDYDAEPTDTRYAVEGNDTSAYRGVSPEYATYANDTEKPLPGGWSDPSQDGVDEEEGGNESPADSDSKSSGGPVGVAAPKTASTGNKGPSAPKSAGK